MSLERPLVEFVRHAELVCGVECVGKTASQEWRKFLPRPVDLTWIAATEREQILAEREQVFAEVHHAARRLQIELDRIEANRKRGRFTVGTRRRRSGPERLQQVRVLVADGLVTTEIADRLGVGFRHAQRLVRDAQNGAHPTEDMGFAVHAHKTPANQGVKTGGLGPSEHRSTMRNLRAEQTALVVGVGEDET